MKKLDIEGVEYRLGSAGGGNQLRQPYLKNIATSQKAVSFKNTEHIHFLVYILETFQS